MQAIIPAAGHGTRFQPVTRVIPKEMLPIGARPALELIVEEARAAGAREIILVLSPEKALIRRYFEGASDIRFVDQTEQRGLGHAVLQAAPLVTDAQVLVLLGDALVVGGNAALALSEFSAAHGGASVLGLERVARDRVSHYGIAALDGAGRVTALVEKPAPENAPSDLAIAGRYLLDSGIFDYLRNQTPGLGGEIQLTDALARMLAQKPVYGLAYPGRRLDIGNPRGYFEALKTMGLNT